MNAAPNTIRPRALELAYKQGSVTTDEVVELTGCEKSQAVKTLGNLKSDGFVTSEPGERDGKKCAIYNITKAGRVKVENNRRASIKGSAEENTAASVAQSEEESRIDELQLSLSMCKRALRTAEFERDNLAAENAALKEKLASIKPGSGLYLVSECADPFSNLDVAREWVAAAVIHRGEGVAHIAEVIATARVEPAKVIWE